MKVSLGDYVDSPNLSREKKSIVCKSIRISVPAPLAAIVDSIDAEEGGDAWARILILSRLHTSFGVQREYSSNCVMAFAMQRILDGYSLNRLLRTSDPWGSSELSGRDTDYSIDVPNFIFDAAEYVFGSSWRTVYARSELDKAACIIESKNVRVTKRRLSAFS